MSLVPTEALELRLSDVRTLLEWYRLVSEYYVEAELTEGGRYREELEREFGQLAIKLKSIEGRLLRATSKRYRQVLEDVKEGKPTRRSMRKIRKEMGR